MREHVFKVVFPFGGSGNGARGFLDAEARLESFKAVARFECLGGIDVDPDACADFEHLTRTPELCANIEQLTVADIIRHFGADSPHCIFLSPPCKGASGLLSDKKSKSEKYERMNRLALVWMRLMLGAWKEPPALVLLENVPRLKTRAAKMLKEVRRLLRKAGYVLTDGFHDCGELGGLAQHRRRYLLVARHPKRCPPVLYQPPTKRVRGCGEVLEKLPVPGTAAARALGKIHDLPNLAWVNWVRLATIPKGGDWRDLEGVLAAEQERREVFKRHAVEDWSEPTGTVGGSGSNGVGAVADPRARSTFGHDKVTDWEAPTGTITTSPAPSSGGAAVADPRIAEGTEWHPSVLGVKDWEQPAGTITSAGRITNGSFAVADPRIGQEDTWGGGRLGVTAWEKPSGVVAGQSLPGNGRYAVADPRIGSTPRAGVYGVQAWEEPAKTVTGELQIDNGPGAVADPRFTFSQNAHRNKYTVGDWAEPAPTVIGATRPGSGAPGVADPRLVELLPVQRAYDHGYGVLSPEEPSPTVAAGSYPGQGAYSIADPRHAQVHGERRVVVMTLAQARALRVPDPKKPPPFIPVIIAEDGTWHRPLTTLELAALQGFPLSVDGKPLKLAGKSHSGWRERIGNAVPAPAARAIAEKMLVALAESALGAFSLSGDAVWVQPEAEACS